MQICKTAPFTPSLRKQSKVFVWYYLFLFLIYSPGETSEVYGDIVKVSKYKRSTWSVFCVQGVYETFLCKSLRNLVWTKSGQVTPNYEGRKRFRDSTRSHLDDLVSQAAGQSSAWEICVSSCSSGNAEKWWFSPSGSMLTLATVPSSTSMENLLQRTLPRTAARSSWRSRALARSPQVSASIRTWEKTLIRKSYIISCTSKSYALDRLNSSHLSSSIKFLPPCRQQPGPCPKLPWRRGRWQRHRQSRWRPWLSYRRQPQRSQADGSCCSQGWKLQALQK